MTAPERSRTTRLRALIAPGDTSTIVLLLSGPIGRCVIPALCEHVRGLLERSDRRTVVCDIGEVTDPDAATVDTLSRLQLTAKRFGVDLRVAGASIALHELTDLMGLSDVLLLCPASAVEPGRKPEQGEEPRGVEEEGDPGDTAV